MDSCNLHRYAALIGVLLIGAAVSQCALASGARQGVKAQPGEIVLLRDVSTRPAYRPAPPGMALIADPSPRKELGTALGAGGMSELSDDDYASMGGPMGAVGGATRGIGDQVRGALAQFPLGQPAGPGGK